MAASQLPIPTLCLIEPDHDHVRTPSKENMYLPTQRAWEAQWREEEAAAAAQYYYESWQHTVQQLEEARRLQVMVEVLGEKDQSAPEKEQMIAMAHRAACGIMAELGISWDVYYDLLGDLEVPSEHSGFLEEAQEPPAPEAGSIVNLDDIDLSVFDSDDEDSASYYSASSRVWVDDIVDTASATQCTEFAYVSTGPYQSELSTAGLLTGACQPTDKPADLPDQQQAPSSSDELANFSALVVDASTPPPTGVPSVMPGLVPDVPTFPAGCHPASFFAAGCPPAMPGPVPDAASLVLAMPGLGPEVTTSPAGRQTPASTFAAEGPSAMPECPSPVPGCPDAAGGPPAMPGVMPDDTTSRSRHDSVSSAASLASSVFSSPLESVSSSASSAGSTESSTEHPAALSGTKESPLPLPAVASGVVPSTTESERFLERFTQKQVLISVKEIRDIKKLGVEKREGGKEAGERGMKRLGGWRGKLNYKVKWWFSCA